MKETQPGFFVEEDFTTSSKGIFKILRSSSRGIMTVEE
jgi:hypothetical protein